MAEFLESKLVKLTGAVDGSNRVFTTPDAYEAGSITVFVNGLASDIDDAVYGWTEASSTTVQMAVAPLAGDLIQAVYQKPTLGVVLGSPAAPTGEDPP